MNKPFRDQLIESEPINPTFKEKYEREVKTMLEIKMSKIFRWSYLVGGILALSLAAFFTYGALFFKGDMFYKDMQMWGRIIFTLGAILSLIWAGLMLWIVKTGVFHLKKHPSAMAGLAWVGIVFMTTIFLVVAAGNPDSTQSVFLVVASLVFLICTAAGLILTRVGLAELNTRERLLKIELRLAELTEKLQKTDKT
jgi:heme/copper-type cytochrome/quinol oxidase subunit 4